MDVTAVAGADTAPQTAAPLTNSPEPNAPSAPGPAQPQADQRHPLLADAVAKLFGTPNQPQNVSLNVSYRVENPHEIVTVFSDPKTGKEVAQFPAEIVVQIAQFFDKHSGVTLDRSA